MSTLDELRAQADNDNPPTPIGLKDGTDAVLPHFLRLPQATRDGVREQLRDFDSCPESDRQQDRQGHIASQILRQLAGDKGEQLVAELDGDITLTLHVLSSWRTDSGL